MEPTLQFLALTIGGAIDGTFDWLLKWADVLAFLLSFGTLIWTSVATQKAKKRANEAESKASEAKTIAGQAETKANDAEIRATEAKEAAEAAKADLRKFGAIANFSSALSLIDDIVRLQRNEKWEMALERFGTLRGLLNELHVADIDAEGKANIQSCISQFNETESKVEKFQNKTSEKPLNVSLMNEVMKNQRDKLQVILAKLKSN